VCRRRYRSKIDAAFPFHVTVVNICCRREYSQPKYLLLVHLISLFIGLNVADQTIVVQSVLVNVNVSLAGSKDNKSRKRGSRPGL